MATMVVDWNKEGYSCCGDVDYAERRQNVMCNNQSAAMGLGR